MATLQVRAQAGRLHRGLQVAGQRLRRAGADLALPRRGSAVLCGAAVRALDAAVRPRRSRSQGADQALCPARLHHRRRRPAAAVPALRARRGRQRGPAAQRLARDAAEQSAGRPDPKRRRRPRAGRAGGHGREGRRQVQEDLGGVRPGAEGGAVRGSRAARAAAGPVPLRQHGVGRSALAQAVRRRSQAQPDRDLLSGWREHRAAEGEPEARGGAGARPRGAAAGRSDRRLLDDDAGRLRGQADEVAEPGRRRFQPGAARRQGRRAAGRYARGRQGRADRGQGSRSAGRSPRCAPRSA